MSTITTFAQAQDALRPLYENARTLYNLDNMQTLMQFLDNPQDKLRIIHIAGTSGKTSTAYYAAALLKEQGLQVGLTVSPHVDTINERMQINGQLLPEADYCGLLGEFMDIIADCPVKPSYFEALTALAYWHFAKLELDYAVIEVGMGGEMDATNVINRPDKVCIITDIGLDHTEILGDTLAKIAWYKAGIIKKSNHVFMYEQGQDVMQVVREVAKSNQAQLQTFPDSIAIGEQRLPLFQQRNLGLARQAIDYVNYRDGRPPLSETQLTKTAKIIIPARLERFKVGDKLVIVDGSHNEQKLRTLFVSIQELYADQPIAMLVAFVQGNEQRWQSALDTLFPLVDTMIFTTFHSEKDYPKTSVSSDELVKYCQLRGYDNFTVEPEPAKAYQQLLLKPQPIVLITGSFYLLNHIRPLITGV